MELRGQMKFVWATGFNLLIHSSVAHLKGRSRRPKIDFEIIYSPLN